VNKKQQKNFDLFLSRACFTTWASRSKSFLVLFFKKELLSFLNITKTALGY